MAGGRMTAGNGTRVVIVEDHAMLLESLTIALERDDEIDVVGTATTLRDGMGLIRAQTPDVVLTDVRLPDGDGIEAAEEIRSFYPEMPVVIMTARATPDVVARAVRAGCAGFLHKGKDVEDVAFAVRAAAAGRVVMTADAMSGLTGRLDHEPADVLSEREFEVLLRVARGEATSDIADDLVLSVHTVRNHIRNVLAKLDASSKLEGVTNALRDGIIEVEDLR